MEGARAHKKAGNELYFVTVILENTSLAKSLESEFESRLAKIIKSLSGKMARIGDKLEYVSVVSFGDNPRLHRLHSGLIHAHMWITGLPDAVSIGDRIKSAWWSKIAAKHQLQLDIQIPRSIDAVSNYIAGNLRDAAERYRNEFRYGHQIKYSHGWGNVRSAETKPDRKPRRYRRGKRRGSVLALVHMGIVPSVVIMTIIQIILKARSPP